MKSLSAGFQAQLESRARTLCTMLRLDLQDGTSIGLTSHDHDLPYDLGDGSISYSAQTGILPSDVVLTCGLEADNFEITGPIGDTVSRAGVIGGRFTRARARLFVVNWASLADGEAEIMAGKVAEARVEGGRFILQVRSAADAFNQVIGRTLSPYCSADFGDALCGITRTAYPCTVTAVTNRFTFTVDLDGDHPDDFFNLGMAEFATGENAGTKVEVFDYTGASGAVQAFVPLASLPAVGDTLSLYRGCSKLRMSDTAGLPTCLSYANVENFRGFPDVPGSDTYLKIATPGAPGA